jgi:hypothetical protein
MAASSRVFRRFEGTISTGGAATADATLAVSSSTTEGLWLLHAVYVDPTTVGGGAATYDIRISETSGWTNDDHAERYANTSTAVATRVTDVMVSPIPVRLDSSGNLYIRATFDAGTTHTVTYSIDLEHLYGG